MRDQFYNGQFKHERVAMVMRAAPSWFRFGSFEIHDSRKDFATLQVNYHIS